MPLLGLSYILFSYYYFNGWWNSSIGTVLILFFSYLIWKKDFLNMIGLRLNLKTGIKSLFLAGIFIISSLVLMKYIANKHNISIFYTNWKNYYHDIFYILNEEIVIGAIILFTSVKKYKISPIVASIGLALVFSLIHYAFYKWIFNDRGIIEISTLVTLFFIGFVRNNLILQTGHITYSWALHFGWMVIMFGSRHIYTDTKIALTEPVKFNTYLGSKEMLIISIILAFGSLIYWKKGSKGHYKIGRL